MSPRAALADALLITIATPATWPLALAAFLLRGGVLVVLLPVIVLPSPVSLGNVLGPAITTVVLSGVPIELAIVTGSIALGIVSWVVVGGLIAATVEAAGARIVTGRDAAGLGLDTGDVEEPIWSRTSRRILTARLLAHVPTLIALVWGLLRLIRVAYVELTSPSDVVSPIALRVLRGAPEVIVVLVVVWMFGEIVGGIAARRVVLGEATVRDALGRAIGALVRRPVVAIVGFSAPAAALLLILLPSAGAAALAWRAVRVAMGSAPGPLGATVAVLIFVALWTIGLVLIAVTTAWRAAVWSMVDQSGREPTAERSPSV